MIEGGYFHDDGTWVDENTLLITLIGTPEKVVYEIAKDLCTFFRQESVMITCSPDNPASERTIIANGGEFEKDVIVDGASIRRYWIAL